MEEVDDVIPDLEQVEDLEPELAPIAEEPKKKKLTEKVRLLITTQKKIFGNHKIGD